MVSWGPSLGSHPGPNYNILSVPSTTWIRIKIDVDFDVVFLSFWARFGAPLEQLFGTFWRLVRAKLVPKPSSNHLLVEKVVVHETICFPTAFVVLSPGMAPQNDPRWLQEGFGIVLIASFCVFRFHFVLAPF